MRTLALWCFRHRRLVVVGWLLAVVALVGASQAAGTAFDNSLSLPGTDSAKAEALLRANAPKAAGDAEQIVVATKGGATLTDPAVRAQAEALFARLARLPGVTGITSPYSAGGAAQLSADGTVGFATLTYAANADAITTSDGAALVTAARSFRSAALDVAVEGEAATKAAEQHLGGVGLGIIAALVVLFLVFGSLLAASLPIAATLLALPAATSAVALLAHVIAIPESSGQVVTLIALGVGVDYALFIVTRMRQGLQDGRDVESAIVNAVVTSGRAVLLAGAVVCVAMLGLLVLGVGLLSGLGIAASIGVIFTMATSVTLLPALLGFFGVRVLSRKQRRDLAAGTVPAESGVWWRWSAFIARRPALPAVAALFVVGILAVPFFSLRLGFADAGNAAPTDSSRQAYDLLARGFGPGFNGPLQIAVEAPTAASADVVPAMVRAIAADPGVAAVAAPTFLAQLGDTRVSAVAVYPSSAPQDAATDELVHRLRGSVIPTALRGSGAVAYIGGATATSADISTLLGEKIPLFIGVVVLLSFLLLTVVLRSIVVPLVAALMNLLSAGATFGVLSAAYVWGWGGDLLGAGKPGPIEAPLPVVIFAILFGLSMDYQVFLTSRILEEWRSSGDNRQAVTRGLAITGRTITAAALIMIVVFGSFILGGNRLIREFGLGLSAAVFVDAFLIRVAVVPAVMLLLGRWNWWLPRRLDAAMPHLALERPEPLLPGVVPVPRRVEESLVGN
ncbi:MAG: putative drug exporter of the superfamily [Frankiales bacterium]|jgi:RND superfamily putative drug exporter|nr:putative drug exporter of the superfamily [Frankiales bacterium]